MVALIFLLVITSVFGAVLALESADVRSERRPTGLLTWITSGNWPAKVGGALMIVGVGALLRYAAINFDAPPDIKLGVGISAALGLGLGSFLLAEIPQRRAISLALGGAAFGVAYLTAYSAFALFGYLPTLPGLGLLALTAVAAGVFAVTRSALSLAVLSMVGAFIAPAFAVEDPGAQVVYRYYAAISVLTLIMVAVRGWRPLIHLSFLFTLAGGAFFAWTADYFSRDSGAQMMPLVVMLVATHVAMPLVERRWTRGRVVESLDACYLLALPVAAALTAVAIAPSRAALAMQLWWFAAIWTIASLWMRAEKREGVATHALLGLLMFGLGLAARFRGLPWDLLALGIAVAALVLAARRPDLQRLQGFLAGLVLVLGAVHMIGAASPADFEPLFLNPLFFERLVGTALLGVAAITLRRLRHRLDSLMIAAAASWALLTLGAELARIELISGWLLLHWALVAAGLASFVLARRWSAGRYAGLLVIGIVLSALVASVTSDSIVVAWISAPLAGFALLAMALRAQPEDAPSSVAPLLAAAAAPLAVALWVAAIARHEPWLDWQFPLAYAAGFGLLMMSSAALTSRSRGWFDALVDIFATAFTLALAAATIFDIGRGPEAVILELLCVVALIRISSWNQQRRDAAHWIVPATVIGVALMLQANLLRLLGPAGELNALSVARMDWPTLVSLLWASIGASLTIIARRVGSRAQWSAGAAFLVGAAVKLLLLDFGSLGQLANILAVIAAGGVFLLVGWLAPMPPAQQEGVAADTVAGPAGQSRPARYS